MKNKTIHDVGSVDWCPSTPIMRHGVPHFTNAPLTRIWWFIGGCWRWAQSKTNGMRPKEGVTLENMYVRRDGVLHRIWYSRPCGVNVHYKTARPNKVIRRATL